MQPLLLEKNVPDCHLVLVISFGARVCAVVIWQWCRSVAVPALHT